MNFMLRPVLAVALLALGHAAQGQDLPLSITGAGVKTITVGKVITTIIKTDVTVVAGFPFTVDAKQLKNTRYTWTTPPGTYAVPRGGSLEVRSAPKGELRVDLLAETFSFDGKEIVLTTATGSISVNIGDVPGPKPPPDPDPPPPQPVSGLRVLIIEESMERTKLPASQILVLTGKPMRDWLDSKCMADAATASGKAWAIWDKDVDASAMSAPWQAMLAKGKVLPMPVIVIAGADGNPVFVGPLPAAAPEAQALVEKYVPSKLRKAG